jgi:phage head maturation protease
MSDHEVVIRGFAHAFDTDADDGRRERFAPGAFRWRSLRLISEHGWQDGVYARTSDGSLSAWQDRYGLAFEATMPLDRESARLGAFVRTGEARLSYGGLVCGKVAGDVIRDCWISELSVVRHPAYPGTAAWVAGDEELMPPHLADLERRWRAGRRQPVQVSGFGARAPSAALPVYALAADYRAAYQAWADNIRERLHRRLPRYYGIG